MEALAIAFYLIIGTIFGWFNLTFMYRMDVLEDGVDNAIALLIREIGIDMIIVGVIILFFSPATSLMLIYIGKYLYYIITDIKGKFEQHART